MQNYILISFSFLIIFTLIIYGLIKSVFRSLIYGNTSETPEIVGNSKWTILLKEIGKFKPIWYANDAISQTFLVEHKYNSTNDDIKITEEEIVLMPDGESIVLEWFGVSMMKNPVILVFIPGLGGDSESCYIKPWYNHCIQNKFTGIVVNRRGFHIKNKLSSEKSMLPSISDTQDMIEIFKHIRNKSGKDALIIAIGYSAGANHMVKSLTILSDEQIVNFGISISCNHDLVKCCKYLQKSWWMNCIFATSYRNLFIKNKHVSRKWIRDYTCITSIDDGVAKCLGFKDILDYYTQYSSTKEMENCKTPIMYIMSKDDPLLDGLYDTLCNVCSKNPNAFALVTERGGHVAWIDSKGNQWISGVIVNFINKLIKCYS